MKKKMLILLKSYKQIWKTISRMIGWKAWSVVMREKGARLVVEWIAWWCVVVSCLWCSWARLVLRWSQGQWNISSWPYKDFCVCLLDVTMKISVFNQCCLPSGWNFYNPLLVLSAVFDVTTVFLQSVAYTSADLSNLWPVTFVVRHSTSALY